MKRFDIVWFWGLLLLCTDALAKRRRSGGSALVSPDILGWVGAIGLGIGVIAVLVTYGDAIGNLLNLVWIGVLIWLFGEWNVNVAWCIYAEAMAPDRLSELCVARDGEPLGEHWRYGFYAAAAAIYSALLVAAVWFVAKRRRQRSRRIGELRRFVEATLRTKLPNLNRERLMVCVADCEAMVHALERKAKRALPNERVAAVVDLWIALTERSRAVGRELTQDEVRAVLDQHRIWAS